MTKLRLRWNDQLTFKQPVTFPAPPLCLTPHARPCLVQAKDFFCLFQAVEEEEEMDPPDSASRVFCSRILSMVNVDDVNAIILAQKNM